MERRLAAILMADVVGYSRMMGEDEAGTLALLQDRRRDVIDPAITRHRGRIIKLMGDGVLVEFASVVDAVQCAVTIQRALPGAGDDNKALIQLRIGINLGDVMAADGDIYGDGVNIAARLEAAADPGGICISGSAYDQVVHKVDAGFDSLGELRLKNITEPVRAYRVLLDPAKSKKSAASRPRTKTWVVLAALAGLVLFTAIAALFLWPRGLEPSQRPSIAVLPFSNSSGDPKDAYYADGITEDLITDLAKLSGLDVISRNSVFKYKGQQVDLKDVARDLDVRYVLEGSIRKMGEQIRINAEFIEAATGARLWGDKYERNAAEVFAIEKDVVEQVVEALGVKTSKAEVEMVNRPPTANLEAYDYFLRGEQAARSGQRPLLRKALEFYEKAITLDPAFADAYAADARTAVFAWRNVYDDVLPSPVAKKRAYEMAGRALELNPRSSQPYATLAVLQAVDGQYDQAIASARRAVGMGPSNVDAHIALGFVLSAAGQHAEAAAAIQTAQRLDPNLSATDRQVAGLVLLLQGDHAGAVETLEQARAEAPGVEEIHILLAAAHVMAGRIDDGRAAATAAMRLGAISVESYRMTFSYLRNSEDREMILAALSKAGLHQWPSNFQGEERDRLKGDEILRLVFGHTLQGRMNTGSPAIMQIGQDGSMVFRAAALLYSGRIFVDRDRLCQQSDSVALGRVDCGWVYRRNKTLDEPDFAYANGSYVFYFSPVD